jgi:predicted nucleic acid-binding protein
MIVDASVAIKWLVPEEDSELATQLLLIDGLTAPELIAAEMANAIWKKQRKGEFTGVPESLGTILRALDVLEPLAPLAHRAAEIAIELDHPAYDCFYLALAEATGERIVTADQRLMNKVTGTVYRDKLITLQEALA